MDTDMLTRLAKKPASARIARSFSDFMHDERGAMSIFMLFLFIIMLIVGGIAVDVMRFEMRRVALQQTIDRAVLAAASLTQPSTRDGLPLTPTQIANDWFAKAGLGDELTVDYYAPTVTAINDASLRRVTANASVRSYNFFMHLLNINVLEGPAVSEAAQGVSQIEVMLVLDITGSMGQPAVAGDPKTKIAALRDAASTFVTLVKQNDTQNGVSIGMVPYAAQVNLPVALRQQFTTTNVSSWNFVDNAGVQNPFINCIEVPTSTYTSTALSTTLPMRMAAVADISGGVSTTGNYVSASTYPPQTGQSQRLCTTTPDNPATVGVNESEYNLVVLPTKDGDVIKARIGQLKADGNTSIAVGMRWGTALIDGNDDMRDIYTAIGDPSVAGRPVSNSDVTTRKIIILMTDGSHVSNNHIKDSYKSGPSPIWRGSDGKYAIRFWSAGGSLNSGTLPHQNCSGWSLATTREYFVPHLKRNTVKQKLAAGEAEGEGTGTDTAGACDPKAWKTAPEWTQLDAAGLPVLDAGGNPITIVGQRLDWSEVWRYLRVDYVARQLYMRSNVGGTSSFNTLMNSFRQTYLAAGTMDTLLQQNCTAAKTAGIEIYGIAFAAPTAGATQIRNCATSVQDYYFDAANQDDLLAAFREIATQISELRLTQ
jgi:Flp pilus assembly protein TadG